MVNIYTAQNAITEIEGEGIAYSLDGSQFQFYASNPVLMLGTKDFRDTKVFWHREIKCGS